MRTDLIWRAALPAAALLTLLVGAPRAVPGGLVLLGLAVVAERLVRLRGLGPTDRVLVGVGGVLVTLVLTGMGLGSTPLGLSAGSWVVALALVSAAGLVVAAVLPARESTSLRTDPLGDPGRPGRRTALLLAPWIAVAAAVVAVSVSMSATSLATADAQPLQMSFGQVHGRKVEVVVSGTDPVGLLVVHTASDGNGTRDGNGKVKEVSYPSFSLEANGTHTTTVSLPGTGRYVITLGYPDQSQPLRTLVLDR